MGERDSVATMERADSRRSSTLSARSKRASVKSAASKRASVSSTSSTSSSKRKSKRKSKSKSVDTNEMVAKATRGLKTVAVTTYTFLSMGVMFVLVYVAHKVLEWVNKNRKEKLSKKDEILLMGQVFRRTSAAMIVDMNPFWSHETTSDIPQEELPKKAIYMANHNSFADPWCLSAAQRPVETKYVGKADLFDYPIVGNAMIQSGDMKVEFVKDKALGRWRSRTGTIDKLMNQAREYLNMDIGVSVFPEGSVSLDGTMLPFKPGFFNLAVEMDVPIIPVGMWGTAQAWPNREKASGSLTLCEAEMKVHIGKPIYPEGRTVEELIDVVYNEVRELRNGLPNFDLPEELAYMDPKGRVAKKLE